MAKILVVDDSAMFREELDEALTAGGHDVVQACDGLDGLRKAESHTDCDLLITDFNMPEMNGLQMVEMIRKVEGFEKTPIFVLTTETSPELKKHAIQVGIIAWVIKPFVAKKLLAGIDKVLKTPSKIV